MRESTIKSKHISNHERLAKTEKSALKNGSHATFYASNNDRYYGEWKDDKKSGNGTLCYHKSGAVYEGQFANDLRHGYGTYSVREAIVYKEKTFPLLSIRSDDKEENKSASLEDKGYRLRKIYAGQWVDDMRSGHGTAFYKNGDMYEGGWRENQCHGWGTMHYDDGTVYEGEWYHEKRHGQGILRNVNGDRYEGLWFDDHKEGPGKFIFKTKRQVLEGEWTKGLLKCGTLKDLPPLHGSAPKLYPIPQIELADPKGVLALERELIQAARHQQLALSDSP